MYFFFHFEDVTYEVALEAEAEGQADIPTCDVEPVKTKPTNKMKKKKCSQSVNRAQVEYLHLEKARLKLEQEHKAERHQKAMTLMDAQIELCLLKAEILRRSLKQ